MLATLHTGLDGQAGPQEMFSVDHSKELWPQEDAQGGSLVSSISGQSKSEFENYTTEAIAGQEPSRSNSAANGSQAPFKVPGVLRMTEKTIAKNGQRSLPLEKAFSIQIGWRLFRLSGASIMSDGKARTRANIRGVQAWLISLEHLLTFPPISRNKCGRRKAAEGN